MAAAVQSWTNRWRDTWRSLGGAERALIVLLFIPALGSLAGLPAPIAALFVLIAIPCGLVVLFRLIRLLLRKSIWRVRDRLILTYAFIALIPILLILVLAGLGVWGLTSQISVFLVRGELDRRITGLSRVAQNIAQAPVRAGDQPLRDLVPLLQQSFPGVQVVLRQSGRVEHSPPDSTLQIPPGTDGRGVLVMGDGYFAFAHARHEGREILLLHPLTGDFLSELVPGLGQVALSNNPSPGQSRADSSDVRLTITSYSHLPPARFAFDYPSFWISRVPVATWDRPASFQALAGMSRREGAEFTPDDHFLGVTSRPSAIYDLVTRQRADILESVLPTVFYTVAIIFGLVVLIAITIGAALARSITNSVHNLYTGTQRVMSGDFSHRIPERGRDQLAALSHSFNRMTERVEQLLTVAKEKERLQSELQIAREVQAQLFPTVVPEMRTLCIRAKCEPARMVSGDYFDFQMLEGGKIALALGDVAGKGISAALLMATLQSSLRAQLRQCLRTEQVPAPGGASTATITLPATADLVSALNKQLHASTTPEKYATFFLAVYDEETHLLTYTNAGHLPPLLLRNGQVQLLEVNGMVVGAFPQAPYTESRSELLPGDLLLCYTDGITEPENEYGEQFGEERLIELLTRHATKDEETIIQTVLDSVQHWTGSPELQDDMTLLMVRRT